MLAVDITKRRLYAEARYNLGGWEDNLKGATSDPKVRSWKARRRAYRFHRVRNPFLILLVLVLLGITAGCTQPYRPPAPVDPYPYSFTDPSKVLYPCTRYGALRFISDARALWQYQTNHYVREPQTSTTWMRGDCDDFAVMLAYYLQEYFAYDTFVLALQGPTEGHAVCFVERRSGLVNLSSCSLAPYITVESRDYDPVDFTMCPGWMWKKYGGEYDYAWRLTYNVETGDPFVIWTGRRCEWYEMVDLALSTTPAVSASRPSGAASGVAGPAVPRCH